MLSFRQETSIAQFYRKKGAQIEAGKAKVAAARKLACVVWKVLVTERPYFEAQERLSQKKRKRMRLEAARAPKPVLQEELDRLASSLGDFEGSLARLPREDPP